MSEDYVDPGDEESGDQMPAPHGRHALDAVISKQLILTDEVTDLQQVIALIRETSAEIVAACKAIPREAVRPKREIDDGE